MSEPIGQGHTEPVGWQELMAVLEMELKGAPELVHREELMVVGQPEQIRSNADVRERGAVPNRDEGSRAIGSRFARIPGHTRCENTNDRCLVPDLHRRERSQMC